ncbi:zinc ribbon domain-containing protein [Holdemania filiformis]|uniref:Zinc ribbon domain-containing protein n=1 Tax=Holdemania filiformis TaxID=61171 RepID=A0A412FX05_9FIRM|nr:zinc ribbon domain-containing protein [Holdemania filiformis]MBS5002912.1 zinc ribbon domain-containing protein [Holdemania filiformis]RGR72689.1 zinc ribbon domain-containing protein [Holdemania filiformis]
MICPHCGKENGNNNYCKYCGHAMTVAANLEPEENTKSSTKKAAVMAVGLFVVVLGLMLAMNLNSSLNKSSSYSGNQSWKNEVKDPVVNTPVKSDEEIFADVASTFRYYYQSYINASNEKNSDWIDHCTEALRQKQAERIYNNNADYIFENTAIWLDMDSYSVYFSGKYGYADFYVSVENDAWNRYTNEYVFNNPALSVEAEYDGYSWVITNVDSIDRSWLGSDYRNITNY